MRLPTPRHVASAAAAIGAVGLLFCGLAGCGSSGSVSGSMQESGSYSGVSFAGKAMAGPQPLIGAAVQVYAAGTSGDGSSGMPLLSNAITTDANGAFTVPAGYTCPSTSSQVYVVARGGKTGAAAPSANAAVALLTALGPCSQIASSSQIVINEVTTVAAAYALSQFLSAGGNVGASSTNAIGMANAAAMASALVSTATGTSPGPTFAANGSSPAAKIDSLANLLNACAAASPTASACTALFSAATPSGGSAPTNTLDAALNLVRAPGADVAALYTLSTASSAFAPALTTAPADWALAVNYTGGGMNSPQGVGVDSGGNVWVSNYFNVASLFSPLGKPLLLQGVSGFGLSASYGLAVDANNNAWIPNEPNTLSNGTFYPGNSISVLNESGQSVAGSSGYTGGGLDYPDAIAIDTDGSAWIVDFGDASLTHLSSAGAALSGTTGYQSAQLEFPVAVAIDGSHNVWLANQTGGAVTKAAPSGSQYTFTSYSCCDEASDLAIDRLGNVWVTNYYGNSISEISNAGTVISNGSYTGGGLDHPQGIAIDGAGNVWVVNYRSPSLTELAGASTSNPGAVLSPANGFGADAVQLEAYAIAVDASGNLWISNTGSNTLTEYIGLAAPVRTPLIGPPAAP